MSSSWERSASRPISSDVHKRTNAASRSFISDPRRATLRRRDASIQIRKQRQDAVLRRRRGLAANVDDASMAPVLVANDDRQVEYLESSVEAFVNQLSPHPEQLRHVLSTSSPATIQGVFAKLLLEQETKARALVHALIGTLQKEETREGTLSVLLDITSAVTSDKGADDDVDDNYYGQSSLRWSDLFVSPQHESNSLIQILLLLLQQQQQPLKEALIETTCHVIGNMVQEAPSDILTILIPHHWSLLVSHWPLSCYCCATIVRHDFTHYGMDFLTTLTPHHHIAPLLSPQSPSLSSHKVDAAWTVEALSRREEETVRALCSSSSDSSVNMEQQMPRPPERSVSPPLVDQLVQCIHAAATTAAAGVATASGQSSSTTSTSYELLVPALRAVGNLVSACNGQFLATFLECAAFVQTINALLDNKDDTILLEALYAVSTSLAPVQGSHDDNAAIGGILSYKQHVHPVAVTNFVPRLINLVTSDAVRLEGKREAVAILADVVLADGDENQILCDVVWKPSHAAAQLQQLHDHQSTLLSSLLALVRAPDVEAVASALCLLDRLLRCIPTSRTVFESVGGVQVLENVCAEETGAVLESSAEVAANLLDDLFDTEDDGETESAMEQVGVVQNHFSFGIVGPGHDRPTSLPFANAAGPFTTPMESNGLGRGRGRPVPSWMQQQ